MDILRVSSIEISVNMVDFGCADPYSNMFSSNFQVQLWIHECNIITMHFKNFEFIKSKDIQVEDIFNQSEKRIYKPMRFRNQFENPQLLVNFSTF